ncbi:tetratricopeptide repeat protein, partial [Bacillus haynesii]
IGGLLTALAVGIPGKKRPLQRLAGWVLIFVIGGGALYSGTHSAPVQENAMLHQAAKWYEEGDYEKVKDALQEAGSKPDASSDTLKLLAYTEIKLGEYENAEKRFEAVVEKDPSDHASLYNLAWLYAQKGELAKAEQSVERALAEKPDEEMYKALQDDIKKKTAR